MFTIETPAKLTEQDIRDAARLTAAAFGRADDNANLKDTRDHVIGAEMRISRDEKGCLAAYAVCRRLWRGCSVRVGSYC